MIFIHIPEGWTFARGQYSDEVKTNDCLVHEQTRDVIELQLAIKERLQHYTSKSPKALMFKTALGEIHIPIYHKRVPLGIMNQVLAYAPRNNGKYAAEYTEFGLGLKYSYKRQSKLAELMLSASTASANASFSGGENNPSIAASPEKADAASVAGSPHSWFTASHDRLSPAQRAKIEDQRQAQRDQRRGPERRF
ncbi:MAG: hypothetical protein NTW08_08370 [Gammaproteobacteria bacterium]|nr:hypothetical protein [Gammaproteobacteria bacterium]